MQCKSCGETIPGNSKFCLNCGQRVEAAPTAYSSAATPAFRKAGGLDGDVNALPLASESAFAPEEQPTIRFSSNLKPSATPAAPVSAPAMPTPTEARPSVPPTTRETAAPASSWHCSYCGSAVSSEAVFCNKCGRKLTVAAPVAAEPVVPEKKAPVKAAPAAKKSGSGKKWIIVAVIAVLLVAAAVLALVFFTDLFAPSGPGNEISAALEKTLNAQNYSADFSFYNTSGGYTKAAHGTYSIALDTDAEDLTLYLDIRQGDDTLVTAIYKNYLIYDDEYGCRAVDAGNQIDQIFATLDTAISLDLSATELMDTIRQNPELAPYLALVDEEALENCLAELQDNFNDSQWMETYMGYRVEESNGMTNYCFRPDLYPLMKNVVSGMEDVFVSRQAYEQLADAVEDLRSAAERTEVSFAFGVKDGMLANFTLTIAGDSKSLTRGESTTFQVDFRDFGKAQFPTDRLERMLAEAEIYSG